MRLLALLVLVAGFLVVWGEGDEVVATRTVFPARDYATVVLIGLAVAVLGLRPSRIIASLALGLAALAVWFGVLA